MAAITNMEETYAKFAKKYKLPEYKDINQALELSAMKDIHEEFLIRTLRRRLVDVLFSWTNYLHNLVMPNQNNLISVNEYQQFTDDDRNTMTKIMTQLMILARQSASLEIFLDEKKDANYINTAWKEWAQIKKELQKIVDKNLSSWQKAENEKITPNN